MAENQYNNSKHIIMGDMKVHIVRKFLGTISRIYYTIMKPLSLLRSMSQIWSKSSIYQGNIEPPFTSNKN